MISERKGAARSAAPPGYFQPINTVYPTGMLSNQFSFVRLQRTNKVPLQMW